METIFFGILVVLGGIIFVSLQRRFASETLINGFMTKEVAKDFAPMIFKDSEEIDS